MIIIIIIFIQCSEKTVDRKGAEGILVFRECLRVDQL